MFHSLLAVLGGFATMAIIVMITTALAAQALIPGGMRSMMTPGTPLPAPYLAANLLCSALAAIAGGVVTARIAGSDALGHGLGLAALMVVMSFLSARQAGDRQPRWYQLVLTCVMPCFALLGAWLGGASTGAA